MEIRIVSRRVLFRLWRIGCCSSGSRERINWVFISYCSENATRNKFGRIVFTERKINSPRAKTKNCSTKVARKCIDRWDGMSVWIELTVRFEVNAVIWGERTSLMQSPESSDVSSAALPRRDNWNLEIAAGKKRKPPKPFVVNTFRCGRAIIWIEYN